ncbi:hypothetical protein D3C78_1718160 [compost metagenome]
MVRKALNLKSLIISSFLLSLLSVYPNKIKPQIKKILITLADTLNEPIIGIE